MGEQLPYKQWVTGSSPVAPTRTVRKNNMREWLSGRASPCQGECRGFESRLPLQKILPHCIFLRRYSQVVRPRSAKPLSPGSNPGGASITNPVDIRQRSFVFLTYNNFSKYTPSPVFEIPRRRGVINYTIMSRL